jgi:hypothetical protein
MTPLSDAEIVMAYNAELRGLANYYRLAHGAKRSLGKLYFLWQGSLFRTLAAKHKTTVRQIATRLRDGNDYAVRYVVDGTAHRMRVFKLAHLARIKIDPQSLDREEPLKRWINRRSEVIERLNARVCELCGRDDLPVEIHHVRRLADVKRSPLWVRLASARQRKRFVLCVPCHSALHAGGLPDQRATRSQERRAG